MKTIKIETIDNTLPSKLINNEGLMVAVLNMQLASALQMMSEYWAPNKSSITNPNEVYFVGMCGGYYVYVDPSLTWDNNIITLVENIEDYQL